MIARHGLVLWLQITHQRLEHALCRDPETMTGGCLVPTLQIMATTQEVAFRCIGVVVHLTAPVRGCASR